MIFVHSRKDTANTAKTMLELLTNGKEALPEDLFKPEVKLFNIFLEFS